jgi:hypothetical protein
MVAFEVGLATRPASKSETTAMSVVVAKTFIGVLR